MHIIAELGPFMPFNYLMNYSVVPLPVVLSQLSPTSLFASFLSTQEVGVPEIFH